VASARNAQNAEIARAEKVVAVTGGLTASPALLGMPRGATRSVRFSIAEPAESDIAIALSVVDPSVFTVGATQVTIGAGQTHVEVPIVACSTCPGDPAPAGRAVGNSALIASSARGPAVAIASVSDPSPGQTLSPSSAVTGIAVSQAPTAGHLFTPPARTSTVTVRLLSQPLAGDTPLTVTVTSSNPAVATATATAIQPGEQTVTLTINALTSGVTVLTVRAGTDVRTITIIVGSPTPGSTPVALGAPVGVATSAPPTAGQVVTSAGRTATITIKILLSPHSGSTALPVSVTSSDPAIATAVASAVQPGSQVTTLTITTLADGVVSLTLRAGTFVGAVGVFVGAPPPAGTPLAVAAPVGVSVVPATMGHISITPGSVVSATIGVQLLAAARGNALPVTITTSNPSVVSLGGSATLSTSIAAGDLTVPVPLLTIGATGVSVLRFEFDGTTRELVVVVGNPSPTQVPTLTAPVIGIRIDP
jgi:hypothetical protein